MDQPVLANGWIEVRRGFGSVTLSKLAPGEFVTASGKRDGGYIVWKGANFQKSERFNKLCGSLRLHEPLYYDVALEIWEAGRRDALEEAAKKVEQILGVSNCVSLAIRALEEKPQ